MLVKSFGNYYTIFEKVGPSQRKQPPEMLYKNGVLKNFTKFTKTHLSFLHRYFPVNFVKFLRTHFSRNTSGRLWLFKCSKTKLKENYFFKKKICMIFQKSFFFCKKSYLFKINICIPFQKILILFKKKIPV